MFESGKARRGVRFRETIYGRVEMEIQALLGSVGGVHTFRTQVFATRLKRKFY